MLALSPLTNSTTKDDRQSEMESFSIGDDDFPDFSGGNLLDSIDFDDLFVGINDGDVLPDLEMDSEILGAEFSLSGGEDTSMSFDNYQVEESKYSRKEKNSASEEELLLCSNQGEDVMSKINEDLSQKKVNNKGKKSSSNHSKNAHSKRKVKVDWTPELHRRFVQAVEQLGVDKAVPSRILELMGIDCLTRHNIASHLQKYRSHRKHLLAREAEAASWNQKRHMYGSAAVATTPNGGGGKKDMVPWVAPTMGFPPPVAPMSHFRPLHVWGHPSVDQSLMHVWPKHVSPSPSPPPPPPPPTWAPHLPPHLTQPPIHPSFGHFYHQRAPNSLIPGTPCFAPPMVATRFPTPSVPGIPPPTMYKVEPGIGVPTTPSGQTLPKPPIDFQPSKESIDAALGDVLSKPWLPLPLGLKQPSVDSVLVELQRQGISKIPPT